MTVVDSSAVLALLLREPDSVRVFRAIESSDSLIAPALLPYEVMNGLRSAVRQRRLDNEGLERSARHFLSMPWAFDLQSPGDRVREVSRLADRHDLTVYDAAYLELLIRQNRPLVSLDAALRSAARAEHAEVLPKAVTRDT